MQLYSHWILLILFVAIVALGVLLSTPRKLPEGFYVTNTDFCGAHFSGDIACMWIYERLASTAAFASLSDASKVNTVSKYIAAAGTLAKESTSFKNLSDADKFLAVEQRVAGSSTEGDRQASRLAGICPTSAQYDAKGKIRVEPSGEVFATKTDYVNYLAAFYKNNPNCKVIGEIQAYTEEDVGILGGKGTGTASAAQVGAERNDRTVINQALSDLYDKWDSEVSPRSDGSIPVRTFQFPAPGEQTYAKTPINSLDDYEYNRVFELENRPRMAPLSQDVKNNLLGAMQLDWPTLPYSSDTKAKLEEQFVDARMQDGFREPKSGVFFRNMEGVEIAPPDEDIAAAREAKILSAYQPTDITTHVVDDEYERVAKVVAQQYSTDPDWEPVVEKRGPHQYAVTELRPRQKKNAQGELEVNWEEAGAPTTTTIAQAKQQGLLEGGDVKPTTMSIQDNLQDPFFAKTGVADHSNDRFWRYDQFSRWSSGLERMFAPTDPTNEWH